MGRTMTNIQDRLLESKMTEIEQVAKAAGRPIKYLASSLLSKEDLVQELLERIKNNSPNSLRVWS